MDIFLSKEGFKTVEKVIQSFSVLFLALVGHINSAVRLDDFASTEITFFRDFKRNIICL